MSSNVRAPSPHRVVIVAFDGVQALDVTGPSDVFEFAGRGRTGYEIEVVAPAPVVTTSSGLRIVPHATVDRFRGRIDTLIVAGAIGERRDAVDEELIAWLRRASRRARRTASVCTGAFLLARAGILDGRKATTHWAACADLAREYPAVTVLPDPIYVRDGDVYTSAGVSAGIDLALALVEEDLGPQVALQVARQLVLFIRRPGGQTQFSRGLAGQAASRPSIRELQDWIADHLDHDLSVTALADRALMSPRNFARVFATETGSTPAAYVEAVRLERARMLLESSQERIEEIARQCGFGTVETLRRSFSRHLHVSPHGYRQRFATAVPFSTAAAG
ncbi:GlxA family transcriptional regulator [Catenulispora pinisilvae]|uniref:GlxA family transcriptional regulator n=1 Tax=Catenulispora pinisilvae TaxID=2705253 RepID=UPI001892335D|nr:GlxA family transcriptional regulator [Catenulispora pinisilvae]